MYKYRLGILSDDGTIKYEDTGFTNHMRQYMDKIISILIIKMAFDKTPLVMGLPSNAFKQYADEEVTAMLVEIRLEFEPNGDTNIDFIIKDKGKPYTASMQHSCGTHYSDELDYDSIF